MFMNSSNLKGKELPKTSELKELYQHERYRHTFWRTVKSTVFMLVVVAAFAILIAVLFLPILRIYGDSMKGTLNSGDIVVSVKSNDFESSDVVAFYYNNNILVKRVIAEAGDWVDMDKQGNVYVNNQRLDEPYLANRDYGHTDIEFPYQVPENRIFVMGDNRKESIDSRNNAIGTVADEQIVGKLVFKIWPLPELGWIE